MVIVAIAVIGVVLVAALIFGTARRRDVKSAVGVLDREARRRDVSRAAVASLAAGAPAVSGREIERAAARECHGGTVAVSSPPALVPGGTRRTIDEEAIGVTRRQFLNRAILGVVGLSIAGFGTAVIGYLWPVLEAGGFGSVINAGAVSDILLSIADTQTPFYSPDARAYVHQYPAVDVVNANVSGASADPILAGFAQGWGALYQKCPHLGCRVPWCLSSQWFECPCHGSQYNRSVRRRAGRRRGVWTGSPSR